MISSNDCSRPPIWALRAHSSTQSWLSLNSGQQTIAGVVVVVGAGVVVVVANSGGGTGSPQVLSRRVNLSACVV